MSTAGKGHLKQSLSIIAWDKVCWLTCSPKCNSLPCLKYNVLFSSHLHIIAPTPLPWNPLPIPVSAAVGGRKTIIPKNQIFKQQGTTAPENYYSEVKNLKSIQASGLWYANNKLHQRTIVHLPSQPAFCLLTKKRNRTQSEDVSKLWSLICLQIYISALPDGLGPGWSPRLNLYWWPSTHPLARALTLHYPEFLGIR